LLAFVTFLLTTFAFTQREEGEWNQNYSLGQQFALFARAAHFYVQDVAFDDTHLRYEDFREGGTGTDNLITLAELKTEGYLPAEFEVAQIYGPTVFQAFAVIGPLDSPDVDAPTAYAAMDMTVTGNQIRSPLDIAAFRAGAASMGFYDIGIPTITRVNTGECRTAGNQAYVSWSEGRDDCLSQEDIDTITKNHGYSPNSYGGAMTADDAIGPAWEAALAKLDTRAVMRRPQPGVPNGNVMSVDMGMQGTDGKRNAIRDAAYIDMQELTVAIDEAAGLTGTITINPAGDPKNRNPGVGSLKVANDTQLGANPSPAVGEDTTFKEILTINKNAKGDPSNVTINQGDVVISKGNVLNPSTGSVDVKDGKLRSTTEGGKLEVETENLANTGTDPFVIEMTKGGDIAVGGTFIHSYDGPDRGVTAINGGRGLIAPVSAVDLTGAGESGVVTIRDEGRLNADRVESGDLTASGKLDLGKDLRAQTLTVNDGAGGTPSLLDTNDCVGRGCPDGIQEVDPEPDF
jgi:hypothetical protein